MALKFEITGDNSNLLSSLDGAREGVRQTAEDIRQSGLGIEEMFKRIGTAAGIAFSLDQAKNFISSVMGVRGQFQQLEIAFSTMLQSEEKAAALMSQLVETAAKTPFDLKGVAEGAKQLLAYGTQAEEVNETITRLGDIAAGLSIPLGDLVYLYGTTMTQGRMFTMDLRQFMGRGIPMAEELAKQFGVTKDEVAGLVTAGRVSADAVKKAIWDMTNEGSKFGGLMEKQSQSITGQISNIEDAIDEMLNEIGKQSEGLINSGLSGVSLLVENWETIGNAIMTAVAMYGEYKVSLMLISAYQGTIAKQEANIEAKRIAGLEAAIAATNEEVGAKQTEIAAIDALVAQKKAEMQANLHNAEISVYAAKMEIQNAQQRLVAAKANVAALEQQHAAAMKAGNYDKVRAINTELYNAKLEQNTAQMVLNNAQTNLTTAAKNREAMATKLSSFQTQVDTVNKRANTTATGIWAAVTNTATKAWKGLKTAMATNPFGLALMGITAIVSLLPLFTKGADEAADANKKLDDSFKDTQASIKSEQANIDALFDKLRNAKEGTNEYKTVKDQILNQYGKYLSGLNAEIATLKDVEGAYNAVSKAARNAAIARGKEAALKEVQDTYGKDYASSMEKLQNALNSRVGGKQATDALTKIQTELQKTGTISAKTEEQVRHLFTGTADYGNSGAWIQGLRRNEKYLKDFSDLVEQRFHLDNDEEKQNEIKKVRNKNAIEEEKKNLQAQLDNLSKEEAAGKKGIALKKKINKLNSELNVYNVSDKTTGRARANSSFKNTERQSVNTINDADRTAEEEANRRQRDFDLHLREKEEQAAQSQATRDAIEQARIARIENDGEREREAEKEQHLLNLRAIDEREKDMKKALYEYNKNVWENRNKNNKLKYSDTEAGKAGWEGLTLTKKQQDELEALREKENSEYSRLLKNREREELLSMRDYLKEYGNYQQRKQAIAEDYAERIKRAQNEGERLTLERELEELQRAEQTAINDYLLMYGNYQQKKLALQEEYALKVSKSKNAGERLTLERELEEELSELDMSELEKSINWEAVFNSLDKMSIEHLKKLKEQLKEALNAKDITAENAAVISERINTINGQIQKKSKVWQSAFGLVIPELEEIRRLERESEEAQERLAQAEKRQAEALKEVAKTRKEILELLKQEGIEANENQITATGQDAFIGQLQGQGKDVTKLTNLFSKLGKQEHNVAQSTEALSQAQGEAGMAAEAAGGSFASTVAIIDAIVHGINDNVQSAKELFEQMDLADTKFGKGWSAFAESSQYATDAWESLKSGNIMGVANGVYGSLRTLGNALGSWGISGFGDSDKHLQEDIEKLIASNEALEYSIDELADKMSESAVVDAEAIYKQQIDQLVQSEKNTQEMMSRSAAAYSNGFLGIGGHHSSNAKIDDSVSSSEWDRISKLIGKNVRSAGDFFNLTSEQMYRVAVELPDVYVHIKDLADNGYKDAAQFMDTYIDYAHQREELEKAYMEKLTSVTFDSIQNEFASALMDMDSDAETFAENFEKYMQQAIINSLVSEQYKPLLEKWYKAFGSFMDDGSISESEMRQLRETGGTYYDPTTDRSESFQSWSSISDSALAMRDTLKDVFRWNSGDYKQEASSKGFQAMGQDVGEELNGRFTALQIAGESVAAQVISIYSQMIVISQIQVSSNTYLSEIRNMMIDGNSYLEDIAKYSKKIYIDFATKLDDITTNTK